MSGTFLQAKTGSVRQDVRNEFKAAGFLCLFNTYRVSLVGQIISHYFNENIINGGLF